jgi:hypothetical protein
VPNLVEIGRTVLTLLNYLVEFVFSSAAVLYCENCHFLVSWFLDSVNVNHPAMYGANGTYRFQIIQRLVKLMYSSAAILDLKNLIF